MRQIFLLVGVTALALSGPALAQGKGNGNGHGKGGSSHAEQGQRHGGGSGKRKAGHGERAAANVERGNRGSGNSGGRKAERGAERSAHAPGAAAERKRDRARPDVASGHDRSQRGKVADRGGRMQRAASSDLVAPGDRKDVRRSRDGLRSAQHFATRRWNGNEYRYDERPYVLSSADGCPPGLAKKNNGCLPPGQARKLNFSDGWSGWYPERYRDDDWRYGNGYLYRVDRGNGLVSGFLPLLGGALFGGNAWPAQYTDYQVPDYYDRFYGYDDAYDYRYADDAIFAVDPQTQAIQAIAGLLTGDDWSVGQPMPLGYDLYNVPPDYRSRYVDDPDSWYRYSDGYVYEVDPTTRLVRSVIELLG